MRHARPHHGRGLLASRPTALAIGRILFRLATLCLAQLACVFAAAADADRDDGTGRTPPVYTIQLATSDEPPRLESLPDLEVLRQYKLYTLPARQGDMAGYRLRLGFFSSLREAQNVREQVIGRFPGSWILRASAEEQQESLAATARVQAQPQAAVQPVIADAPIDSPAPESRNGPSPDRLGDLMEDGRRAVAQGDYPGAIRAYTRILESPDSPYAQDALEYLGLARERNGQAAHAKSIYEKYIALYPDGPGAERVRQRLAGLLTARETPQEKLPVRRPAEPNSMAWSSNGSFSQYYRRDSTSIDGADTMINQSALFSDVDLSVRGRNENYDIRARVNGGYTYDFLSDGENLSRINSLFLDISNRHAGLSGRLGRQTRSSDGVFGRFDGLLLSYQTRRLGKFNLVGGYPVEHSSATTINRDKVFYGIGTNLPAITENWDYSLYAITQQVDDLTDRQAIGGEARFLDSTRSLFALLDYDVHFQTINIFSLLGNWTYHELTTFNFSYNHSRSPFLGTYNALIGQPVTHVDDLLAGFTEDEIADLALDRSAVSRALSAGITRSLNSQFQLNADVTISNLSSTPASGGVAATDSTQNEFFYAVQLIGNSIFRPGDLAIIGVLYADTSTTNTTSVTLNTRFPVRDGLRINPKLRLDYREFEQGQGTEWITTPAMRFDYRYRRYLDFEAELGGQWSRRDTAVAEEKSTGYYVYLGYILGF